MHPGAGFWPLHRRSFLRRINGRYGAEVIRIERVGGGEDRYVAPVAEDGSGSIFMAVNRNKKAMTLNPMKPEGRDIVKKLVASAQAMSGAMHLSGLDGQPTRDIVLFEDYGTSLFAAFGAICALYEKQKSGLGQCVDTYQTQDGWIVVSVVGNPVFKRWTALVPTA